jgi:hypothetical protein
MPDESPTEEEPMPEALVDFPGNEERTHASGERAAEQINKLLGTFHAGLGVTLAAWLQRVFEQAGQTPLSPLAYYLAVALCLVMAGLVSLGLAAVLDMFFARFLMTHLYKNKARFLNVRARKKLGDHPQAYDYEEQTRLVREAKRLKAEAANLKMQSENAGNRADLLNSISEKSAVASLVFLVIAFSVLAFGVMTNIHTIRTATRQVATQKPETKEEALPKPSK